MLMVAAFVLPLPPLSPTDEPPEFTIFTLLFQATATAAGLVAANVAYFAGPLGDLVTPPHLRERYRRWAYAFGVLLSVIVITAIPVVSFGRGIMRVITGG